MSELFHWRGMSELFPRMGVVELFHWRGFELFHRRGELFHWRGSVAIEGGVIGRSEQKSMIYQ